MTFKSLLCSCFIFSASVCSHAKEWQGVRPLHSSRASVEQRLGAPKSKGKYVSSYEFENEFVDIYYASGAPCGTGLTNSWRVPADTVVSIRVTPKKDLSLEAVGGDESRYKKTVNPKDERVAYFTDEDLGVRYTVHRDTASPFTVIDHIDYFPDAADDRLKCASSVSSYSNLPAFESYGRISQTRRKAILDNFAIQLSREGALRGYIVAHDRRSTGRRMLKEAHLTRRYLVRFRGIQSNRIIVISGEPRDEEQIELFLIQPGAQTSPF